MSQTTPCRCFASTLSTSTRHSPCTMTTEHWEQFRWALKKLVTIETTHGPLNGLVHAIDPETGNIILLEDGQNDDEATMHIVVEHSITRVIEQKEGGEPTCTLHDFSPDSQADGAESTRLRRDGVLKLLHDQRIDAHVDETSQSVIVFDGLAEIVAPYTWRCVRTANEVVLARITNLMTKCDETQTQPDEAKPK